MKRKMNGGIGLGIERFQYCPAITESTAVAANQHPALLDYRFVEAPDSLPAKAIWFWHSTKENWADPRTTSRTLVKTGGSTKVDGGASQSGWCCGCGA